MRNKLALIILLCYLTATAHQARAQQMTLTQAFKEIAAIPDFTVMSNEEAVEQGYTGELGQMQRASYGNSDSRELVLYILSNIPEENIYREFIKSSGKIRRCYIEEYSNGKAAMLYVKIGKGPNNIFVVLYTGATAHEYRKASYMMIPQAENSE